jgi:hypothetical protein
LLVELVGEAVASPAHDPLHAEAWVGVLARADQPARSRRDAGETTAVVVAVAEELVAGANCGDSGAWFVQADGRVRAALEARGVPLAETALAPRVSGDIRGSVQVSEVALSGGDAAGLARPRPG